MRCRICGTENKDYLRYCVMCGAPLPEGDEARGTRAGDGRSDAGPRENGGSERAAQDPEASVAERPTDNA